jgi:hypothetical protein
MCVRTYTMSEWATAERSSPLEDVAEGGDDHRGGPRRAVCASAAWVRRRDLAEPPLSRGLLGHLWHIVKDLRHVPCAPLSGLTLTPILVVGLDVLEQQAYRQVAIRGRRWLSAAPGICRSTGYAAHPSGVYAMGASRTPAASAAVRSFWSQTAKSVSAAPTASRLARWTASAPLRTCRLAR